LPFQNFRTWNKQTLALAHACNIPLAIPFSELTNSVPIPDKRPFPETTQTIGDHIKSHRLKHRIPVKTIIEKLGVSRDTLRGWELNLFQPFVKHYPKIIQLLGYYPLTQELNTLGGKIKKYRFMNGLTQRQFADLMDTDVTTIWFWEADKRLPLPLTKKAIEELVCTV
jgi:transcriptional regulator with XRE-family HTH domain